MKKMWVHVIQQKAQSRKDSSREACKFMGLENLVPIPFHDSPLRAKSVVQIHDYYLYSDMNISLYIS